MFGYHGVHTHTKLGERRRFKFACPRHYTHTKRHLACDAGVKYITNLSALAMLSSDENPISNAKVTLREVTRDTVRTICNLHVSKKQEQFVAPNAVSMAEAYFSKEAWFRAIYADETPIGFVMLWENLTDGIYFLWRFMLDERFQGKGYGRKALELVLERIRQTPKAKELHTCYVKGEGSPQPFYAKMGFTETGKMLEGEHEMKLTL